jgi:hypothetical protein
MVEHRSGCSIVPLVNRGPSLASCSAAIVDAIVADIVAREQPEAAYRQEREAAFRAAERYPLKVAEQADAEWSGSSAVELLMIPSASP